MNEMRSGSRTAEVSDLCPGVENNATPYPDWSPSFDEITWEMTSGESLGEFREIYVEHAAKWVEDEREAAETADEPPLRMGGASAEDHIPDWEVHVLLEDEATRESWTGYYRAPGSSSTEVLSHRVRGAILAWLDGASGKDIRFMFPADDGDLT